VRNVRDHDPPGPEHPRDFGNERRIVLDVLEKIDDHDQVEARVGEGKRTTVDLIHMIAHQLPDCGDGQRVEIGAGPFPAPLSEQIADYAVVPADVQSCAAPGVANRANDLTVFRLLEH
jgi:hypothetical protein